MEGLLEVVP